LINIQIAPLDQENIFHAEAENSRSNLAITLVITLFWCDIDYSKMLFPLLRDFGKMKYVSCTDPKVKGDTRNIFIRSHDFLLKLFNSNSPIGDDVLKMFKAVHLKLTTPCDRSRVKEVLSPQYKLGKKERQTLLKELRKMVPTSIFTFPNSDPTLHGSTAANGDICVNEKHVSNPEQVISEVKVARTAWVILHELSHKRILVDVEEWSFMKSMPQNLMGYRNRGKFVDFFEKAVFGLTRDILDRIEVSLAKSFLRLSFWSDLKHMRRCLREFEQKLEMFSAQSESSPHKCTNFRESFCTMRVDPNLINESYDPTDTNVETDESLMEDLDEHSDESDSEDSNEGETKQVDKKEGCEKTSD